MPSQGEAQAIDRPNIVIILADDLGWGDVGYHGGDIKTPHIDSFAKEGVILNHFYTAPICSPNTHFPARGPDRAGHLIVVIGQRTCIDRRTGFQQ